MSSTVGNYVRNIPNHDAVVSDDELVSTSYLGLEVEIEGAGGVSYVRGWDTHEEGSLKNDGREWVFERPFAGTDVVSAVTSLVEAYEGQDLIFGPDGSVHVHVDVTDLRLEELMRMLNISVMLEPVLVSWLSPERYANPFCQMVCHNDRHAGHLARVIANAVVHEDTQRAIVELSNQQYKYSATNTSRMNDLGTVEYRFHRSCCDYESLIRLANVVLSIKEAARDDRWDVVSPHRNVKGRSAKSVLKQVFGELMDSDTCESLAAQLNEGIRALRRLSMVTRRNIDRLNGSEKQRENKNGSTYNWRIHFDTAAAVLDGAAPDVEVATPEPITHVPTRAGMTYEQWQQRHGTAQQPVFVTNVHNNSEDF